MIATEIVVSREECVRNAGVVQHVHGRLRVAPFTRGVPLRDVALVRHEPDVVAHPVRRDPLSLTVENLRMQLRIKLGVGQGDERPRACRSIEERRRCPADRRRQGARGLRQQHRARGQRECARHRRLEKGPAPHDPLF
jgi:hypothetical protein